MYNYYATPFSYHGLHINYTKTFQIEILIPFTNLFHKTLHSYNNFFYQVKVFSKVTNIHIYINQKEIKQEIS
jgi:hypothetical protein